MEKLKQPLLIAPKSVNELLYALKKYPTAQIFAGGTFIMSRLGYYPNPDAPDIISLANIPELTRVLHVDKFVEFGSMATIQQLLNSSASLFSKELFSAIENIGTSVLRRQITVGGALCTPGIRFALPCFLSAVNAQAEIKTEAHVRAKSLISKTTDRWFPVSKLYDNEGNFVFEGKGILSRIRIPAEQNSVQIFKTVGNPMHEPSSTVIMSFTYTILQDVLTNPTFCMVFPKGGYFYNQNFLNTLAKITFPIFPKTMISLSQELDSRLSESCKNLSEVQRERALRLFTNTLYQANTSYLAN